MNSVAPLLLSSYIPIVNRTFENAINSLLDARKWDIKELAARTKLSRVTVSRHINGHSAPHRSTRTLYATAFGITIDALDEMWDRPIEADGPQTPAEKLAAILATEGRMLNTFEELTKLAKDSGFTKRKKK